MSEQSPVEFQVIIPAVVTEHAEEVVRHFSTEPVVVLPGSSNFESANTTDRAKFAVSKAGATTTGTGVGSGTVGVGDGDGVGEGVGAGGLIRFDAELASDVPTPLVAVTTNEYRVVSLKPEAVQLVCAVRQT
jgi:hypothetical protein